MTVGDMAASSARAPLRVGVVGFGWMGRVHAAAYARLHHHYRRLGRRVELVAVADSEAASLGDAVAPECAATG